MREVVLRSVPAATEKVYPGWHNIGYSHGGRMKTQFCAIGPQKDRVNVYLFRGADLADPKDMLAGTGKHMRHVNVRTMKEARSAALKALIKAAAVQAEPKAE